MAVGGRVATTVVSKYGDGVFVDNKDGVFADDKDGVLGTKDGSIEIVAPESPLVPCARVKGVVLESLDNLGPAAVFLAKATNSVLNSRNLASVEFKRLRLIEELDKLPEDYGMRNGRTGWKISNARANAKVDALEHVVPVGTTAEVDASQRVEPVWFQPQEVQRLKLELAKSGWNQEQVNALYLLYAHLSGRLAILLLDSGATHCVVNESLVALSGVPLDNCTVKSIVGIDENRIPVMGQVQMQLVLGVGSEQINRNVMFLVVKDTKAPVVILGAVEISFLGLSLGPGSNNFILGNVPCIRLSDGLFSAKVMSLDMMREFDRKDYEADLPLVQGMEEATQWGRCHEATGLTSAELAQIGEPDPTIVQMLTPRELDMLREVQRRIVVLDNIPLNANPREDSIQFRLDLVEGAPQTFITPSRHISHFHAQVMDKYVDTQVREKVIAVVPNNVQALGVMSPRFPRESNGEVRVVRVVYDATSINPWTRVVEMSELNTDAFQMIIGKGDAKFKSKFDIRCAFNLV